MPDCLTMTLFSLGGRLPRQGRLWISWSGAHVHLSSTLLCYNPLTNWHVIHCMLPHRWQPHCSCLLRVIDRQTNLFRLGHVSLFDLATHHMLSKKAMLKSTDISFREICIYKTCDSCGPTDTQSPTPRLECHTYVQHICLIMSCNW